MKESRQHIPQAAVAQKPTARKTTDKTPSKTKNAIPALSSEIQEAATDKNRLEEVGSGKISVTLPTINSATTPTEMTKMRIPPKVDQNFSVNTSKKGVSLSVENQGGNNGSVQINGSNSITLAEAGEHNVSLKGVDQTAPGNADNLKLVAKKGDTILKRSNSFSVAAIPVNWTVLDSYTSESESKKGMMAAFEFYSDSGDPKDLTEVSINEQVITSCKEGIFETGPSNNQVSLDYQPVQNAKKQMGTSGIDSHRVGIGPITAPGKMCFDQLHIFKDNRTGASEIPFRNSGFKVTYTVTELASDPLYKLQMIVTKEAVEVTIDGRTSQPGLGDTQTTTPIKFLDR